MTRAELCKKIRTALAGHVGTPDLDSELLVASVLDIRRLDLVMDHSHLVSAELQQRAIGYLNRRLSGEPVHYILGEREFWGLLFKVTPATLIPRPDSETLVELALEMIGPYTKEYRILDLGVGSGCLLLSLLSELKNAVGLGVDINRDALCVAQENAVRLGLTERVSFQQSSWFADVDSNNRFDLILSNPPYIASGDLSGLMKDVRDFEPLAALDGGADGLDAYKRIIDDSGHFLISEGLLVLEHGQGQSQAVSSFMQTAGFEGLVIKKDLAGIDRTLAGRFHRK